MVKLFVGFDPREACVYHTFCQSVIEHSSGPVSFIPLHNAHLNGFDGQQDGTNAFIYSRYLVPYLNDYDGWAIFCDGDMLVTADIYALWNLKDETKAVQVVKHDYETQHHRKYIGTPLEADNVDYPRKNWSSVMLFNCGHRSNQILTPEFVSTMGPVTLHRFQWLNDDEIGDLPYTWNWLVGEYANEDANLYHHTLGSPAIAHYRDCFSAREWNETLLKMLHIEGQRPYEMVRRAKWHRRVK